mmetsp:Transcript_41497/g.63342  ORF Transcript_41497/g.63342 Transcript_41497/m.63342 type:complete len:113 (-) Transcript_41497:1367-1705(-)
MTLKRDHLDLQKKHENFKGEYKQKYNEMMDRLTKEKKNQKEDLYEEIQNQKNQIKALQVELDQERNSMTAQEEMMHSLIHNLTMEFSNQKQQMKSRAKQPVSFLEKKAMSAY